MPLDVLGRTRATLKESACSPWPRGPGNPLKLLRAGDWGLQLSPINEEFLRMRPVPGLVDARARLSSFAGCIGVCGLNPDPRSGLPRIFLAVRSCRFRFVRDRRAPVRPPFNGQLRTGTDKGNPTV
ncbi:hypothetical protein RR46_02557 [Papilio xuthus]|uniref:Uncharacterized protein n=1 Tax=Papilio xuthus TaxID=66420 RepID=A0A194Q2T1_PAPXU|nr:hypothetical protein RR46_02557 [Papilio xuthus]